MWNKNFLPKGTVLHEKYKILEVLGQGGFGITYLAEDRILMQKTAVKEYFPAKFAMREPEGVRVFLRPDHVRKGQVQYHSGIKNFLKEAQLLFDRFDVEGLAAVRDYFEENGTAYIVMTYLPGGTLQQYLDRQPFKRIDDEKAAELLQPVIRALLCLHSMGIVHCDISPDNLLFDSEGRLHLIDFGAAKEKGRSRERKYYKDGYAPPEQYEGRDRIGPWTDIYALCAVWYQMLTGRKVPPAPERLKRDRLRRLSAFAGVSEEREEKILRGLSPDIQRRYFCAAGLLDGKAAAAGQEDTRQEQKIFGDIRREWGTLWMQITTESGYNGFGTGRNFFTIRRLKQCGAVLLALAFVVTACFYGRLFYISENPVSYYSQKTRKRMESSLLHPAEEYVAGNKTWEKMLSKIEKNAQETEKEDGSIRYSLSEESVKKEKIISNGSIKFYLTRDEVIDAFGKIMGTSEKNAQGTEYGFAANVSKDTAGKKQELSVNCRKDEIISWTGGEKVKIEYDPADGRVYAIQFTGRRVRVEKFLSDMTRILCPGNYLRRSECHYVIDHPDSYYELGRMYEARSEDLSLSDDEDTAYKEYSVTVSGSDFFGFFML